MTTKADPLLGRMLRLRAGSSAGEFWNVNSRLSLSRHKRFDSGRGSMEKVFSHFADTISRWTGKPATFVLCALAVVVWAVSGPFFGFSETWQLIINTGTTIVTFLMVFLIQSTQNRDSTAVQAKLDELIRVGEGKNEFIGIERLTDAEVAQFRAWCESKAKHARRKSPPRDDRKAARAKAARS